MKKQHISSILLFILILIIGACSEKQSDKKENLIKKTENISFYDKIIKPKGDFLLRSVKLNDKITDVKKKEDSNNLKEETDSYLFYEYSIDSNNFYELEYFFDQLGLNEVTLTTFFSKKNAEILMDEIKTGYSDICDNIIDQDELFTMDSKKDIFFLDIDYYDISEGTIIIRFDAIQ